LAARRRNNRWRRRIRSGTRSASRGRRRFLDRFASTARTAGASQGHILIEQLSPSAGDGVRIHAEEFGHDPVAPVPQFVFGHERGAFTGAVAQREGRFQAADRGTLFLDEIGDLPLELQPKLLRVLQERQVERLGGSRTIPVNVRVIAATNQDLWGMVQEKKFRADLYYRLNVFPINLPPLRERDGDIPLLVSHFVRKFAERQGKSIDSIPEDVMEALMSHDWPGNIRELQNFIERAVIMTTGAVLRPRLAELRMQAVSTEVRTLADAERAHIVATLRETNGVVGGRGGAAVRLGVPRTTLIARMQRLGLAKYAAAQNERPPAQHDVERWTPDSAEGHLVSAAGAGYGSSVREYSYVR
jgi:transcriptional regulator of acetoin/glycerol metabolism